MAFPGTRQNTRDAAFRQQLLAETKFRCKACGADLKIVKYELDHIYPKSRGGSNQPDNFQILCGDCNRSKAARLMKDWAPWLLDKNGKVIQSWEDFGWITPDISEVKEEKFHIGDLVRIIDGKFQCNIGSVIWVKNHIVMVNLGTNKVVLSDSDIECPKPRSSKMPQFGRPRPVRLPSV